MESIHHFVLQELQKHTNASVKNCKEVADRITHEISRICQESDRIRESGNVEEKAKELAQHRLQQCLRYYRLGHHRGRLELHSTLSAMVYRYITPPRTQCSYYARLTLIEDFLQGFYEETFKAFRKENLLGDLYTPRTRLDVAEYMAFSERFAKRRITLSGGRRQQLAILRAQTFAKQQPPETSVDIEQADRPASGESDYTSHDTLLEHIRTAIAEERPEVGEDDLRRRLVEQVLAYLDERDRKDCADYFVLRLNDMSAREIEEVLHLNPRERDYLQQKFKYHLSRFALQHYWELVHQWLEAGLDRNLGLTPEEWELFLQKLSSSQRKLLMLKQAGRSEIDIGRELACTPKKLQKHWSEVLAIAWDIRNR